MKKARKNRFGYWFDNQMSKGMFSLIKFLTFLSVFIILTIGFIIFLFWGKSEYTFIDGIWIALTHFIDTGTVASDSGKDSFFMCLMVFVSFIGVAIFSTLTGIICNVIDEKLRNLRRGKSVVVEKNHIIILGFSGSIYTIISELIEANSNHKKEALVIMDNTETKDSMEEKIKKRFPNTKTTKIICRYGSITDKTDLKICSFDTCKSVIITDDSDDKILKSILVVTKILKECGNKQAYITAVVRDEQNKEVAELAGEGYAEVLSYENVISRIIAHTRRYTGLSQVYTELFDMSGCEFYIEEHPSAEGKTISELNRYFPKSVVTGFSKEDGTILINPESDYRAEKNDKLILLAEDDGVSHMNLEMAEINEASIQETYIKEKALKTDMLVLGYSDKLKNILIEEDHYVGKDSKIVVAVPKGDMHMKNLFKNRSFKNIQVVFVECNIYDRNDLEKLLLPNMKILILANDNEDMDTQTADKRDAKILSLLLQLRYLSEVKGYNLDVTSEMLLVENQELAHFGGVNDFVVSNNITSLITTQISQDRKLKNIFEELLCEEGSELYIRPAENYVKLNTKTDIYTAIEAAARQREIMIGYRRVNELSDGFEIVINPPKNTDIEFKKSDSFILIAED